MVFQLSRTWNKPSQSQQGFPAPGTGAQTTGPTTPMQAEVTREPVRPTQGLRSWLRPTAVAQNAARGFGAPGGRLQQRPRGSMPHNPPAWGGVFQQYTPEYDRGAAAYVPNFGKVLTNPIGAGIVALYRPQASYGPAGQYANGAIWWTSQVVPTSINLQGLTDPQELASIFDNVTVQAVVRTTG